MKVILYSHVHWLDPWQMVMQQYGAAFHPDGQSAATGSADGIVRRWRLPRPPAQGTDDEIRVRIEDETGLWLDNQGVIHTLFLRPGVRDRRHQ